MAEKHSVLPLRRRDREPLQRCESCRRHRRCPMVYVEGVEFVVCDECGELAPFTVRMRHERRAKRRGDPVP